MCTLTFIPRKNNDFLLTQSRDEAPDRIAIPPDFYNVDDVGLLFPKDNVAGGTWLGVSEKNRVVCVLNGGFTGHERKPKYRKSRGMVASDFMISDAIIDTVNSYDLYDIEPFTIVILDWNDKLKIFELVWDGKKKHFKQLSLESRIWSSSTLYSESMKHERLVWFEDFKSKNELNAHSLLDFHKTAGKEFVAYGILMDRGFVKTTSITQIEKKEKELQMRYEVIADGMVTTKMFNTLEVVND